MMLRKPPSRPRTILVVEDNPAMRNLICETIQMKGDVIYECYDGEIAVSSYERLNPDFTLMDIDIEGMNGLKATRKIRTLDPQARIIIVTQYDSPAFRKAAEDAGAAGYVLKEQLDLLIPMTETWI